MWAIIKTNENVKQTPRVFVFTDYVKAIKHFRNMVKDLGYNLNTNTFTSYELDGISLQFVPVEEM